MLAADIHFEPEGHRYTVAGERWPSVTEVLDPLLELDGIPRAVLKAAAEFGTHVHMATDLFDKGILDEPALDPHLAPYLAGWKLFLRDTGATVVHSELRVAHPELRYAGTLDKIVRFPRKARLAQVDLKSGQVPRTVGLQTAGYHAAVAWQGLNPSRYVLQLRPDASYRLTPLTDPADFQYFISALNCWRFRQKQKPIGE